MICEGGRERAERWALSARCGPMSVTHSRREGRTTCRRGEVLVSAQARACLWMFGADQISKCALQHGSSELLHHLRRDPPGTRISTEHRGLGSETK